MDCTEEPGDCEKRIEELEAEKCDLEQSLKLAMSTIELMTSVMELVAKTFD